MLSSCRTLGKFIHSTFLLFPQFCERVACNRQWQIFVCKILMLSRGGETCSTEQVCEGVKCKGL